MSIYNIYIRFINTGPVDESSSIRLRYTIKTVFTNVITEDFDKDHNRGSNLEDNYSPEDTSTPNSANVVSDDSDIE